MQPTISVALCTHNGARFIGRQVGSILAQTLQPTEIVLSDDASSDDTVEIVRELLKSSAIELVVLLNDPPFGVAANFQQALQTARGDLIALCDQDDVWSPRRLERLAAEFALRPELLLVHSDASLVDEHGAYLGVGLLDSLETTPGEIAEIHEGHAFETFLRRNLVTGATTLVSRRLVERAMPIPSNWIHDEWLAMIAGAYGGVGLVAERLTNYRQHSGNQIGARKPTPRDKIRKLREPRAERNDNLLARARILNSRIPKLTPAVERRYLELASGKFAHEQFRNSLSPNRIARLVPILREAAGGGYRQFSRGRADVLRDLLQPA